MERFVVEAVPTFDQLMPPTLRALRGLGGSATNEELLQKVIELEAIPDEVASVKHSDERQTKLNYNLAWAKTYLKKVGAIDNSKRGVWAITETGEKFTDADCAKVPAQVRKMAAPKKPKDDPSTAVDQQPSIDHWKDELLDQLKKMDPGGFERLSQRLLREAGFVKVEVMGRSGDGGIDGTGVLRVNLLSFQVLFQCKRYSGSVGAGAIRDFRGAMIGRCDKGLFITTGTFTMDAQREATRDGAPAIDLVDGDHLCELMKDYKLGVEVEWVEEVKVKPDWLGTV
jgi:restriction system protein